jgi:hypothetical protein
MMALNIFKAFSLLQENGQQDLLQQQLTMLQKELEACRHQYKYSIFSRTFFVFAF